MIEFTDFYIQHKLVKEPLLESCKWYAFVQDAFEKGSFINGYREGVKLLPIKLEGAFPIKHRTLTLDSATELKGDFEPRVEGEAPRKHVYIEKFWKDLPDAPYVFIVLYHADVLAEDGTHIRSEWGVVDHLTATSEMPEPMVPETLIANHFKLDGGTSTEMTPEEFEYALGTSINYWKDKVQAKIIAEDANLL